MLKLKIIEQKENNLANVTLLKSRIGKDGIVFQNCKFNNEYLEFDTDTQNTILGHQEDRAEARKLRASTVYKQGKKEKEEERQLTKKVVEKVASKVEMATLGEIEGFSALKEQLQENAKAKLEASVKDKAVENTVEEVIEVKETVVAPSAPPRRS